MTIRAFVALELDVATRDALVRLQQKLEPNAPRGVRLCPPESLHVTMKFLGNIDEALVPLLTGPMSPLVPRLPSSARIVELTAFPRPARAQVAVASLEDPNDALAAFAASLEDIAAPHGIPREARRFHAHVTLARTKYPLDVRKWLASVAVPEEPARFEAVVFYRSDLQRDRGPLYTPLARWPL